MIEIAQIIITGVFSVVVAFGTVWIKHHLDNKKKANDEENYERISQQDIDSMLEVQEFLDDFREKWTFDRVGIFQFHNGGIFADGSSMRRFSVTHESVSTGIQSMLLESQDVLVTRYMELVHLLEVSPYKIISVESLLDCSLRSALEINNVEYFTVSSLKYSDSLTPMGFVCCHWCDGNGLDSIKQEGISEDSLEQVIEATTKNINIHLTHTNRK
jgi:uncharacterized protein YodC (DUF2158 family)